MSRPRRIRVSTNRFRSLHNVQAPAVGDIVIYNERCRFLKTDRKPRAVILTVFRNYRYEVRLLTNGAPLYCEFSELVPIDGDYSHYRRLLRA
jgi:hypothetical protein